MFSGIVEATAKVLSATPLQNAIVVQVARPSEFQDVKGGDSISCNGICLTLEKFDQNTLQFTMAAETLKVLGIASHDLGGQVWNLERSLRFGDRVHGHLVTGHVEALGLVLQSEALGESWLMKVKLPTELCRYIWVKGSVALHGVSLTVNKVESSTIEVCLIPETLKRTNLGLLRPGDRICVETDYLAKAYFQGKDHGLS